MARKCSVCSHPEVDAINEALISGVSYRRIATQYGLTEASVRRHKSAHLPAALVKASEASQVASADDLLSQIKALQAKALAILDRNLGKDDKIALSAIKEARANLELIGKLLGELASSPTVVMVNNPEWIMLRTLIINALDNYPEAKMAVVNELERLSK